MDSASQAARQQSRTAQSSSDRAQLLLEINNAIVSHLDLAQLMKAISGCLRREIPHDFAGLSIYDAERQVLRVHGLEAPPGKQFLEMWQHIVHILEETKWVVAGPGGAAARLGMKRTTLQAKMKKLGISRAVSTRESRNLFLEETGSGSQDVVHNGAIAIAVQQRRQHSENTRASYRSCSNA